jgi:single-strand DNA-binding protein
MRSVNKVILIGHIVADPELKTTQSGKSVTNFSLATNRDWKSSDGDKHEAVDFHKIVAWQGLAEACSKYLKKGSPIYLEGRLMNKKYKDKNGNSRTSAEIVMDELNFISYKKKADGEEVNLTAVNA